MQSNEPAFPDFRSSDWAESSDTVTRWEPVGGLTKREYFAAMAMQGFLCQWAEGKPHAYLVARAAIEQSDALLAELEKSNAP